MNDQVQQRARSTTEVLALINLIKKEIGVTRLADITHLDNIGIPVYCSYRPNGYVLQANAGKGVTSEAAKCSAMMEALEYSEFEKFAEKQNSIHASYNELRGRGLLSYSDLGVVVSQFYSDDLPIDWIRVEDLANSEELLCPADLVYLLNRQYSQFHTNGIASGNTNSEATLHALYEVIERDAYAQILVDGRLDIRGVGKSMELESIHSPTIKSLINKIRQGENDVYLIMLPAVVDVYAFWCVVLDSFSVTSAGSFNIGLGCHGDPNIAAIRAITEAAQSRLIYIHGNREDIRHRAVFDKGYSIPEKVYKFFPSLQKYSFTAECGEVSRCLSGSIEGSVSEIVSQLKKSGYKSVYRHILRDEEDVFSVVKVIVPGLRCENNLM